MLKSLYYYLLVFCYLEVIQEVCVADLYRDIESILGLDSFSF